MTKANLLKILNEKKEFLEKEFEVQRIGLFGSYAKNMQTSNSDIDFYVEFKKKTFDNLSGLWVYLEELFGKKVDIVHYHKNSSENMMKNIQKEVIFG